MGGTKSKIQLFIVLLCSVNVSYAQDQAQNAQQLADKLSNPVASLISVPFQTNVDYGIGQYNGSKLTLNFQPVIPIKLNSNLNLITRYIIPVVDQRDISGEGNGEFGLADATLSAFFAPANAKNGLMWGLGPAFLIPIGTNDFLSTKKWGVGPTALIIKQAKGLTYGFLVNQLWSFAGDKNRTDINQLFFQPFFVKNYKSGAGLNIQSEMTFNWQIGAVTTFLMPAITGITKLGKQTISLVVGPRIPLSGPTANKPDFGLRGVLTLVFPK